MGEEVDGAVGSEAGRVGGFGRLTQRLHSWRVWQIGGWKARRMGWRGLENGVVSKEDGLLDTVRGASLSYWVEAHDMRCNPPVATYLSIRERLMVMAILLLAEAEEALMEWMERGRGDGVERRWGDGVEKEGMKDVA